jgi:hypothetical protein
VDGDAKERSPLQDEPELVFAAKRHKHPLVGLIHGPYSLSLGAPARLRLARIASRRDMTRLKSLVAERPVRRGLSS